MKEYDARQVVRTFLKENNETLVNVVEIMNANHPDDTETSQNLTNKLLRNTIRFSKVMEIADVLGYEICFRKKDGENAVSDQIDTSGNTTQDQPKAEETNVTKSDDDFIDQQTKNLVERVANIFERINEPFIVIEGVYFPEILIIGDNCKKASTVLKGVQDTVRAAPKKNGWYIELNSCCLMEDVYNVIIYPNGYEDFYKEEK